MKHSFLRLVLSIGLLASHGPVQAGLGSSSQGRIDFGHLLAPNKDMPQGELTINRTETAQETQVIYTTSFTNNTLTNADIIDIVNPIPEAAIYLPNTATGPNCEITFSIDGGVTWDKPQFLSVRQGDGSLRPARANDYTHIRWIYSAGLAPKASSQVSFAVTYP